MKKVILVIACLAIIVFGGMHFLMPEKTTPHLTQFFSKEHKEVQRIQDWLKYKQQQQLLLVDVASPISPKQQGAYAEYIKQKIELNLRFIFRNHNLWVDFDIRIGHGIGWLCKQI